MENIVVINLLPSEWKGRIDIKRIPNSTRRFPEVFEILTQCHKASEQERGILLSEACYIFLRKLQEIQRDTKIRGRMRVYLALRNSKLNQKFVARIKDSAEKQGVIIEEFFI